MERKLIPYFEIILATFFWTLSAPYVRLIGLPTDYLTFIRCAIPTLVMGLWIAYHSDWRRLFFFRSRTSIWNRYTVFASACNLIRSLFYFLGFKILPIGHAILLMYTWPVMVASLSMFVLKERVSIWQLLMGFLALSGIALIQLDPVTISVRDLLAGTIIVLTAAAANAAMILSLQKNPAHIKPVESVFVQNFAGALLLLPIGVMTIPAVPIDKTAIAVGMSIIIGVFAYVLFYSALKKIPTSQASILAYMEVVFTILIASLFLGEPLTPIKIAGGILIVAGSIGAQRVHSRRRRA